MFSGFGRSTQRGEDESKATLANHAVDPQLKILVVEDDLQTQKIMRLILGRSNYSVTVVSDGNEAIQAVKEQRFDLVFMDVSMPIMDGLDATRCIRQWEDGTKHVPIIGTTAIFKSEHRSCLEAGMDAVVWKPFNTKQIYQVISVFVNGNRGPIPENGDKPDPQPTEIPILDVPSAIRRLGGDREVFQEVLDEFISSLSQKFSELKDASEAGDWHSLSLRAHNLKGLSASLGAAQLSRKAEALDRQVSKGQFGNTEQLLQEIDVSIRALKTRVAVLQEQL